MLPFDKNKLLELDLRVLTYLYLCLYPQKTQGDFARDLGTNPATLSKLLQEPNARMKKEWALNAVRVLDRIDLSEYLKKLHHIERIQKDVKESIFASNICAYIGEYVATNLYGNVDIAHYAQLCESTGMGNGYVFSDRINHQWTWYFLDYDCSDSIDFPNREDPFAMANAFAQVWKNFRATLFTRQKHIFEKACHIQINNALSYYRSVMLINEDGSISEHLISTGDTLPSETGGDKK